MTGRFGLVVVLCLALGASVAAQEEEVVLNKKRSEWLAILKEHKEVKFKRAALIALEVIGPKSKGVLDGLFAALEKEPNPDIRREVALLLGRMGTDAKGAVDALGQALKMDKDESVREAAALALGGNQSEAAHTQVMILAGALKDKHAGTREAAAAALQKLGEKAKPALPQLTEVALDKKADRFPRLYAIQIISRFGDEETAKVLITILSGEPAAAVRQAALEGLGRLGEKAAAALPNLIEGLKEKEPELRRAAAVALGKIGPKAKEAWPVIKATYNDSDTAVRHQMIRLAGSLAKEQPQAVALLAEAADKDVNQENRLAAIQELSQLEAAASAAVPTLEKLLQDPRASIRDAAQAALKKIKG